jgi:peptide-methionine (S)-S-oxide reductase
MSTDDTTWREEIAALLARGEKIAAIKVYREHTGVDLATAKAFVEELQRALEAGPPQQAPVGSLDEELLGLLREGGKIEAIKRYRAATGAGLKESKDAVEALEARHGLVRSTRAGCMGVMLVLAAVAAVFWYATAPAKNVADRKQNVQVPTAPALLLPQFAEIPMTPPGREVATLAGGCFWCLEAVFEQLEGVDKVISGYAGGNVANPTYELVCTKTTGHAEVVQVTFDPEVIGYADLLDVFFTTHDPTTLNRQGNDVGPQYRSAIFTHSPEQQASAEAKIRELTDEQLYPRPIVTEVVPLAEFYSAETYHQGYFRANPRQPYCAAVVSPKVAKFRQKFADRLKKER